MSKGKQIAQYGGWQSPISSELIVSSTVALGGPLVDGTDVYWTEGRATNRGRVTLVRRNAAGQVDDITPPEFNVRTRVHEYGGGAVTVKQGIIYASNFDDNHIYRFAPGEQPQPLTHDSAMRYADLLIDEARGRLICVREDHHESDVNAINTMVSIALDGSGDEQVLLSDNDFYANPRLSPDGQQFTWLTWNHPNMPWDGCELWQATVQADGSLTNAKLIAGGDKESIFQPEWAPDGTLYFISDRSGWWNIYRREDGRDVAVTLIAAEFGRPQWVFGMASYDFVSPQQILCSVSQNGSDQLMLVDTSTGNLTRIDTPYTSIGAPIVTANKALFIAAAPTRAWELGQLDLDSGQVEVLRRSSTLELDPAYIAVAQPIEFPTTNGLTAYALFYPPTNADYTAPSGERPPLMVKSHGGPTSQASSAMNLGIQFYTSRGIAVLDVNYGGSTGYGREYRLRLDDNWGIVDVDDCVNGAKYLVAQGLADGERIAITGGSAGGYTTLCAVTFRDTFKAGASHFGIGDLEIFRQDTHKFESHYLERLIGPYAEHPDRYYDRSAINFTARINCPLILFQGLDDRVVPPNQAETMVEALKKKGLPYAYVAYEGEGHGFRQAENIKRTLEGELYFYSRIFGFPVGNDIQPVTIHGL